MSAILTFLLCIKSMYSRSICFLYDYRKKLTRKQHKKSEKKKISSLNSPPLRPIYLYLVSKAYPTFSFYWQYFKNYV